MGRNPSVAQRNELVAKRRVISQKITSFNRESQEFYPDDIDISETAQGLLRMEGSDYDRVDEDGEDMDIPDPAQDSDEEDSDEEEEERTPVEQEGIPLPSCMPAHARQDDQISWLLEAESQLREGQANDELQSLRWLWDTRHMYFGLKSDSHEAKGLKQEHGTRSTP